MGKRQIGGVLRFQRTGWRTWNRTLTVGGGCKKIRQGMKDGGNNQGAFQKRTISEKSHGSVTSWLWKEETGRGKGL